MGGVNLTSALKNEDRSYGELNQDKLVEKYSHVPSESLP